MNPIINVTKDGFLEIEHPTLGPPTTRLSADVAASATSSTVENNDDFATNDLVVFGYPSNELTEIVTLTSTTGVTTLGHTSGPSFAHSARDPVAKTLFNQAEIYTATSETGTYSLLTTVTLNLQKERTIYDASGQTSTTWFKVRYKNNVGTVSYSDYSDTVVFTGFTFQSLHSMTDEILEEFNDPEAREYSRTYIRRLLRAGVRILVQELIKVVPDYNHTSTTQDLTSGTAAYDLPSRFLALDEVWINFSGTAQANAYKVYHVERELSGEPNTTYYKADPRVYFKDDQLGLKPTPDASGRYWISYWYYPTEMTDEADTHGLPYGARDVLVTYVLYRMWLAKERAKAADYYSVYLTQKADYINFIASGRQTRSKRKVEITFGDDMYLRKV